MTGATIQTERIQKLGDRGIREGDYVLYWMQQAQRVEYNHALEFAVQQANRLQQPLVVIFGLMDDYPEANLRHYTFMLEGLQEVESSLAERGIKMAIRSGQPDQVALAAGARASLIVCDRGYLRHQKAWREKVAAEARCSVFQVETDVVVPVEVVTDKAEFAARTIRPKISRHLDNYLMKMPSTPLARHGLNPSSNGLNSTSDGLNLSFNGLDLSDIQAVLARLKGIDRSISPVTHLYKGGTAEAKKRFQAFIRNSLEYYSQNRNQPQTGHVSHMSMYLHFGQISPLYLALRIKEEGEKGGENPDGEQKNSGNGLKNAGSGGLEQEKAAFLDELIVRRELAINFVHFTPNYDSYISLPDWARSTLHVHRNDRREYHYTQEQLEKATTHDQYWNAAMQEMKYTGYLHNYMRMYWGKKILEWSPAPEQAFRTALALNNKYFLDGRDPNSFANIAWIFGLHDRPWKERPIFGKIRFMSASGLERKCDMKAYLKKVKEIKEIGDF
ncbi:MAG: deoxyribodipyrimidine photo-lyase [bacterium]